MYEKLIVEAKNGIAKGFLTNPDAPRRYGAAVLTKKGNYFSSGQYASYNRITNIHAEMAAVLIATMNFEPEIEALALVCSQNQSTLPICCGICLQFLSEHCYRTGDNLIIIRSSLDGTIKQQQLLTDLLPEPWI